MDSWIDFCAHELELPATIWYYPIIGYMPYNEAAVKKAKEDLKIALGALEKTLLDKTYLVRRILMSNAKIYGHWRLIEVQMQHSARSHVSKEAVEVGLVWFPSHEAPISVHAGRLSLDAEPS